MKNRLRLLALLLPTLLYSKLVTAEQASLPLPNKGDTSWMIVATVLVILMTIPGLALFYAGMVRAKKYSLCFNASLYDLLHDCRTLGFIRLQHCIY